MLPNKPPEGAVELPKSVPNCFGACCCWVPNMAVTVLMLYEHGCWRGLRHAGSGKAAEADKGNDRIISCLEQL